MFRRTTNRKIGSRPRTAWTTMAHLSRGVRLVVLATFAVLATASLTGEWTDCVNGAAGLCIDTNSYTCAAPRCAIRCSAVSTVEATTASRNGVDPRLSLSAPAMPDLEWAEDIAPGHVNQLGSVDQLQAAIDTASASGAAGGVDGSIGCCCGTASASGAAGGVDGCCGTVVLER